MKNVFEIEILMSGKAHFHLNGIAMSCTLCDMEYYLGIAEIKSIK